ncbi:MAG: potassium-transporting ATPase subunit KdpA [Spirochaetia bacterium]|nr:potassium-transporting ATPase subunit KdpA [Spirochaetia bacterium]
MLGTNGGGFFGVNSAHPFENPTALSNFFQALAILLLPVAQIWAFGKISKRMPHALTMGGVMLFLLLGGLALALWSEYRPHPIAGLLSWMEGKEVRFGITPSVLWTVITTAASNGSVNAMIDSHSPLTGGVAIFNILLGEIIFGGVGVGLTGMVLFAILTVFLSGLMVGRTPEYLGRKIESREILLALGGILIPGLLALVFTSLAAALPYGAAALTNSGPHGVTELAYAYASATGNNGSAFGGLGVGPNFYNITLSIVMLLSRAVAIFPILFIAEALSRKKFIAPNSGTFPTAGLTFGVALFGVVLILGALTFFPLLVIGPIAEHLLMGAVYF